MAGDAKRNVIPLRPARFRDDPAGLPPARGGFVGRERELDRIGGLLLGPARLVTLIGSGGSARPGLPRRPRVGCTGRGTHRCSRCGWRGCPRARMRRR